MVALVRRLRRVVRSRRWRVDIQAVVAMRLSPVATSLLAKLQAQGKVEADKLKPPTPIVAPPAATPSAPISAAPTPQAPAPVITPDPGAFVPEPPPAVATDDT